MKIEKKVLPEYWDDVASGKKKYELRLNEFECKEGDILVLREWDPATKDYTGRVMEKKITYVKVFKIDDMFWPEQEIKEKGLLVISLE